MNDIDAVSPRFCFSSRDLNDLLSEYGPYQGRYIANYPKTWRSDLIDHLKDIGVIEKAAQKQLLNPYNENGIEPLLYEDFYPWDENLSWTQNVDALQAKKVFNQIIGDAYEPDPFDTFEIVIQVIRQNRQRSINLHGKIGEYLNLIKPLLRKGPAAYLIDPYFQALSQSGESFISRIFENISKSNCFQIHIFSREVNSLEYEINSSKTRYSIKEYSNLLKKNLSRFVPKDKNLFIHLINDSFKNPELHNRFFITKYGGLDFGKGFEHFDFDTAQIPVYIIDRENHINLVNWYINNKAKFKSEEIIKI